jgi:uncharacterized protein YndB with AHSA1/START domain
MATTTVACSALIAATPEAIFAAFSEPARLKAFWLDSASGPLAVGTAVTWRFRVPGATEQTTATALEPGKRIAWTWSDGTTVDIRLERTEGATIVRLELGGSKPDDVTAVANAVEGFTVVLCDLKLLLETGHSPGLVTDKARLIAPR